MSLTDTAVAGMIKYGESLTVEFKGEQKLKTDKKKVSDQEIYEAVVCLANNEGGTILIGVEDDCSITGAEPRHGDSTDTKKLTAAIFNNTVPPVSTMASLHTIDDKTVIAIAVEKSNSVCATTNGKCLRRSVAANGAPQCLPYYPHEHQRKAGQIGDFDYSACVLQDSSWNDVDVLEIERLRRAIRQLHGDEVLLELSDLELLKALRLVETKGSEVHLTVAGLLLVGAEEVIRRALPTHAIAFQVLDKKENVKMNDWFHGPLLRSLEAVEERFDARNQEQEIQMGLLRIPIPEYSKTTFREALNNAVLHRDYSKLGTVFVQWHPDHLFIANVGGFVEGITLSNLLIHEPKPRNTRLAEAFRRIGLVETTGRGIDKIYLGQLRYGRPLPDYSRSDADNVRLVLQGGEENLAFAAFVHEQDRAGTPLQLDDLIVLNHLEHQRRIDVRAAGKLTQRGDAYARSVLERLSERGLVEPRGEKKGRVYHLSSSLYQKMGDPGGYVYAHGFEQIQQEQMVLQYLEKYKKMKRFDAASLCKITAKQATSLLTRMKKKGLIEQQGQKRGAYYVLPQKL